MATTPQTNTSGTTVTDRSVSGPQADGSTPTGLITNGQLAQMAANTLKANATAARAFPQDIAVATSRIVGRTASSNVKDMDATEAATVLAGGAPYTGTVTAALAKLTGLGANGSLAITVANGLITNITYVAPT